MSIQRKPELVPTAPAAGVCGVKPKTFEEWRRSKRYGIPYYKIGGKVYYDMGDLLAWLESRKVRPAGRELQEV